MKFKRFGAQEAIKYMKRDDVFARDMLAINNSGYPAEKKKRLVLDALQRYYSRSARKKALKRAGLIHD